LERAKGVATASIAKHEPKKPAIVEENWAVNLIAFKQDWYAKRKAEEYSAKGVQAKVSKADSKGESWYRLSVDGFKSQYEAAGYAAKVKKSLNLDSVWVAKVAQVSGKE
jgi:cell division protein FtsN